MNQGEMFGNVNGKLVPRDHCARKHGGNPESKAAFEVIKDNLTTAQHEILMNLRQWGGRTVDEVAVWMNTTPNAISGRFTELRIKGRIEKRGTRPTRSGCRAAVWIAK